MGAAYTWLKDIWLPVAALIWGVLAFWRQNRRKLSIRQVGSSITDRVTNFGDLQTLFSIEVAITNESPTANIVIAYYDLELPWKETELEPFFDPAELDHPTTHYNKPGTSIQIPRENVLNHRRYQNGKLTPGDSLRGFFLAKGASLIPPDLIPSDALTPIDVTFVIEDTTGKQYRSKPVHLFYESLPAR
jgi:hypothetical protein